MVERSYYVQAAKLLSRFIAEEGIPSEAEVGTVVAMLRERIADRAINPPPPVPKAPAKGKVKAADVYEAEASP